MSKILYVDDEHASRVVFRANLPGYDVVLASDGFEAAKLLTADVGVVISDYRMPGMSGIELLEVVRRELPRATRVILTAYPSYDLLEHVGGLVTRFIEKPFEVASLRKVIDWGIFLHNQGSSVDLPDTEATHKQALELMRGTTEVYEQTTDMLTELDSIVGDFTR